MTDQRSISYGESERRLLSDDCVRAEELYAEILDKSEPLKRDFAAFLQTHIGQQVPTSIELTEYLDELFDDPPDAVQVYEIRPPFWHYLIPPTLLVLPAPGKIINVRKAMRFAVIEGLGLLIAVMSPFSLPVVLTIWGVASLALIASRLINCYVKLADDEEKLVFEAVYVLQNRNCVTNFDALKSNDYANAYSGICPTMQELQDHLSNQIDAEGVRTIAYELKSQGLLSKEGDRWAAPVIASFA